MTRLILSLALIFSAQVSRATQAYNEQIVAVPMIEANGNSRALQTKTCTPVGAMNANVVIINHGSPPNAADRATYKPYACDSEAVQWFLSRGYIVMSPLRRGYGATGGAWAEGFGACEHPDFFHAGLETARDIMAAADYVAQIPHAKTDGIIVIGQSAGGWGTIALGSLQPHTNIKALINMAGGRGGHHGPHEDQNCAPDILVQAAAQYAQTSTIPMLWIYAENDSFFSSKISQALFDSYSQAGGHATFILKPPFGTDGHSEFSGRGGSLVWGPDVEAYLAQQLR